MKKIILIAICMLLYSVVFAKEALWVTTKDIPAWQGGAVIKTFPKGTKVLLYGNLSKGTKTNRDGYIKSVRDVYYSDITVDGESYGIEAKNIIPIDTPDVFDESFLTIAHYPSSYLLPSYFIDVLKSGTRSTMKKYEIDFIDLHNKYGSEYDPPWWEYSGIREESVITQSILRLSLNLLFLVKRIEKIPNGYKVGVIKTPFPDRLEASLFFQFDGDYVDVYIDDLSNKVLSLTYVSPEFYEGVKTVILDDVPVDLSTVIWPRRADGSSDYDDTIIPRQELPQIDRDPLQDMFLDIDEKATLAKVKETIETYGAANLVNNKSRDGRTVLQTAIANNANSKIITFLIEVGADVTDGLLYTTEYSDNMQLYKLLIKAGADVTAKDDDGDTPLLHALDQNRSFEIINLLIELGADIHEGNNDGKTPLMYAAGGNFKIVKFLIELGADIHAINTYNNTPLIYAVSNGGKIETVKLLIELGVDVDIENDYGSTPLYYTIRSRRNPEIISMLLNAGASFDSVSNEIGWDVLTIAEENRYLDDDPYYTVNIVSNLIDMGWKENSDDTIIWQERGKTYRTTDNLRLRATDGVTGEALFTLPKDTPVRILSIGNIDKIDGIIGYWVEVEVVEDTIDTAGKEIKKGAIGWCFGGYVTNEDIVYKASSKTVAEVVPKKVIEAPTIAVVDAPTDTENEAVVTDVPEKSAINTLVIPLITWGVGGLVLVCAIVVLVLVRKKKSTM